MAKTYQEMKEKVRNEAMEWQNIFPTTSLSYGELAACTAYFTAMGRRYGLLKEFRENGII